MWRNEKGWADLWGIFLLLITLGLVQFYCLQGLALQKRLKKRFQTYLCFKQRVRHFQNYYQKMIYFDRSIAALFAAKQIYPFLQPAFVATKTSQKVYHTFYLTKWFSLSHCKFGQIHPPPAPFGLIKIKENPYGAMMVNNTKGSFYVGKVLNQVSKSFILTARWKLSKKWQGDLIIKTKEVSWDQWNYLGP